MVMSTANGHLAQQIWLSESFRGLKLDNRISLKLPQVFQCPVELTSPASLPMCFTNGSEHQLCLGRSPLAKYWVMLQRTRLVTSYWGQAVTPLKESWRRTGAPETYNEPPKDYFPLLPSKLS